MVCPYCFGQMIEALLKLPTEQAIHINVCEECRRDESGTVRKVAVK